MNVLNWEEYRKLAARSESIPPVVLTNDKGKTPNHILVRLLHAQLGLCTEFTEFHDAKTRVNAIEELGDMIWYLALIDNTISVASLQSLVQENPQFDYDISQYASASHWIAEMADVLKRCIYYAEPFNEANKKGIIPSKRFEVAYWGVIRWMEDIISDQSFPSMGELMHMNIEKLSKRFPDLKFTQQDVLNRNVENELSHIQDTFETTQMEIEKVLKRTLSEKLEKLTSETGMRLPDTAVEHNFIGGDPNILRRYIEREILNISVDGFYEIMGYSLDDYIVSVYDTIDQGMWLKFTIKVMEEESDATKDYAEQVAQEVSDYVTHGKIANTTQDLDFATFSKELVLRFPNLTDQLNFGNQFFAALDNYYSTNGCDAMSKAWKCGYIELMACRPNNAAKAHKDIWAVMDVWGQFHAYGKPLTVQQLHVMFDDQRKLCLCPSMLKK